MNAPDVIPAPIRALAELFKDALGGVKFPDVDADAIGASVERVDQQAAAVARLEDELARARGSLEAGRDELARLAGRAHAYARVFAEDDEPLRARIDAIAMPRPRVRSAATQVPTATGAATGATATETTAPRRRRRGSDEDAPLFTDAAAHEELRV